MELYQKISENTDEILRLAHNIEGRLTTASEMEHAILDIKQLIFILREKANLVAEFEYDCGRPMTNTSDMMPCVLCNNHWEVPSKHVRGIRWEPVAGKGWLYICWECSIGLYKTLSGQMERLSYLFLFSLNNETETQRSKLLKEIEEVK